MKTGRREFIGSSILTLASGLVAIPTLKEFKADDLEKLPGRLEGKLVKNYKEEAFAWPDWDQNYGCLYLAKAPPPIVIPSEIFFKEPHNKLSGEIIGMSLPNYYDVLPAFHEEGRLQIKFFEEALRPHSYENRHPYLGYPAFKVMEFTIQTDLSLLTL
jgi:hypothetical protein